MHPSQPIAIRLQFFFGALACLVLALTAHNASAQLDQGAITGVVQDNTGAVIANADVTLTEVDTGLVLQTKSNGTGVYVFSPIKIGNYTISAVMAGFQTTVRENIRLDLQQRLNVVLSLSPGAVNTTVTVNDQAPLLETQESSVGQVLSTETINNTPLNGRNWVYIAQLSAGVAPPFGGTRGSGNGDFVANGQSAEQNNFILDGVDNNTNLVDFLNGSSYVVKPPPDALAEFKIETSNYSAELGHSAGAVVNASIKSGTNQIHGNLWEYLRNTNLDAQNWNAPSIASYHENQFGGTLGLPLIKNKLFWFGDMEANRISFGSTGTYTVPTALMKTGNFSELLNPSLTGSSQPIQLYQPNSGGTALQQCNGQNNVFCGPQMDPLALKLLNLFPSPNINNGKTYNNYAENSTNTQDTIQWDQRLDWNPTSKDQAYARYSYAHIPGTNAPPLGNVLDGSGFGGVNVVNLAENFMLSETHVFDPALVNEFRFGYNWGKFSFLQANASDNSLNSSLGLGGIPTGPDYPFNGGLPQFSVNSISGFGSTGFEPAIESQNVYQILDNVTKTIGKHSIRAGISLQAIRFAYNEPQNSRGYYGYSGIYTSNLNASYTGFGVADFVVDQMNSATLSNQHTINDAQWYRAFYVQDDWKLSPTMTLNLGIRYDYYQPYKEMSGEQANFVSINALGATPGKAIYQIVSKAKNIALGDAFMSVMAKDNVDVQYVNNDRLVKSQKTNWGPRVGFDYAASPKTVIHGGFGLFYGGLQNQGNGNLGSNFPFVIAANLTAPNCAANNCPSIGTTLENGLSAQTANGLQAFVSYPGFHSTDPSIKTPYAMDYSLMVQRALSADLVASVSYVGNVSRHLTTYFDPNTPPGLLNPANNSQFIKPFPDLGGDGEIHYAAVGTYNSLQAKLEKRYSHGASFLATYTWAHALSDANDAGGLQSGVGDRNTTMIPIIDEYSNSAFDVRHRFTLNGNYELPFGINRTHLNQSRALDLIVGEWSASLTFAAQTGTPFTVSPDISTASGGSARAILIRDPFKAGGAPDPSNPGATCAASTRNKVNWYNPCAFANPLPGSNISTSGQGSEVTGLDNAIAYLGGKSNNIYGPGYERINMSLFKNFITWRQQYLQFRVDAFNLFNHPSLSNPSVTNNSSSGGQITGPKFFQNNTPDSRFLQLALKYSF